jgi:hypothetical protein
VEGSPMAIANQAKIFLIIAKNVAKLVIFFCKSRKKIYEFENYNNKQECLNFCDTHI